MQRHAALRPDRAPSAEDFRAAAARFASGVTVVTTRSGELVFGKTVSSFASLSLDPVLITVSVASGGHLPRLVRESGSFGVSVLARGQEAVSRYFAVEIHEPVHGSFPGMTTVPEVTGAPIVAGCLSFFDCQLHDILPGGDHVILIGRVVATGGGEGDPLVYWRGGYRALNPSHDSTGGDEQRALEQVGEVFAVQLQLLDIPAGRAGRRPGSDRTDDGRSWRRSGRARTSGSSCWSASRAPSGGGRPLRLPPQLRRLPRLARGRVREPAAAAGAAGGAPCAGDPLPGRVRNDAAQFAAEHRLIGEAVARGDVVAAQSEMARHVESMRGRQVSA